MSPLSSEEIIEIGESPQDTRIPLLNPLFLLFKNTEKLLELKLETAISLKPSLLKSPVVSEIGESPVLKGAKGENWEGLEGLEGFARRTTRLLSN